MSVSKKDNIPSPSSGRDTFEQAELALLKEGLQRSYTERFLMFTRLYKMHQTMKKAVITHKPFVNK